MLVRAETPSTLCDQVILADQATDTRPSSYPVPRKVARMAGLPVPGWSLLARLARAVPIRWNRLGTCRPNT